MVLGLQMSKQPFNYTPWIQYESEITNEETGKRHYSSKCGRVSSSTTTVLSNYEDKAFLEVWKSKMRAEGKDPDAIGNESAEKGTEAHLLVEEYLIDGVYPLGHELACTAIDAFYSHINPDYISAEQPVFYDALLDPKKPEDFQIAGRYDQLLKIDSGVFKIAKTEEILKEQFLICDLKTKRSYEVLKSGKRKLKNLPRKDACDMFFKNCLQASMYAATISLQSDFKQRYGAGVGGAVLVYVNEEKSQLMYINRQDLNYYWRLFKDILRDFYGLKPLEKNWKTMIQDSNWRPDHINGGYQNNIPKEITLIK